MNEMLAIVFTIASEHAFFSFVCPHVLDTQPRIILLTAYVPMAKTTMAKYLTPVFRVAQASTKPVIAIIFATVMCHVRSLNLPELTDHAMEMKPAIRYGGQVRTSVIVVLKPKVSTAVGKKFLKPLAARCICCMKANSHS